ncbi:MAG TPA: E3 ubiquitin ligase family protein [Herpetosiphonaceae bacterium]|nr:E3 ubiquitin ligase family protein [Herpetosiphonaceae bacterium]
MVFGGIALIIIAVICFFFARGQANKLDEMNAADTYSSRMIDELHRKVLDSLGSEALAETCEVEGVIECDAPLTAPLSGTPCVAYTLNVVREYEEDVTTTDSDGKKTTSVQRSSETVESNDNKVDFWVRDDTGRTLVRPEQADLDLVQTKEHFQPYVPSIKTLDLGFITIPIPAAQGGRRRTLGYRSTEQILETGIRVYVLGCASDYNGKPAISFNPRKSQKFIVSRRSERDLANSAASWSKNLYFAAAGTGILGALLTVLGLMG